MQEPHYSVPESLQKAMRFGSLLPYVTVHHQVPLNSALPVPCPGGFPRGKRLCFNPHKPPLARSQSGAIFPAYRFPILMRTFMALLCKEHKLEDFSVEKTPKYSKLCDLLLNPPFCHLPPPVIVWSFISST